MGAGRGGRVGGWGQGGNDVMGNDNNNNNNTMSWVDIILSGGQRQECSQWNASNCKWPRMWVSSNGSDAATVSRRNGFCLWLTKPTGENQEKDQAKEWARYCSLRCDYGTSWSSLPKMKYCFSCNTPRLCSYFNWGDQIPLTQFPFPFKNQWKIFNIYIYLYIYECLCVFDCVFDCFIVWLCVCLCVFVCVQVSV